MPRRSMNRSEIDSVKPSANSRWRSGPLILTFLTLVSIACSLSGHYGIQLFLRQGTLTLEDGCLYVSRFKFQFQGPFAERFRITERPGLGLERLSKSFSLYPEMRKPTVYVWPTPILPPYTTPRLPPPTSTYAIPLTLPVLLLATFTMFRMKRIRRRVDWSHCPSCDYDLRGNLSGICSECGRRLGTGGIHST